MLDFMCVLVIFMYATFIYLCLWPLFRHHLGFYGRTLHFSQMDITEIYFILQD
jgi:hypothetical protein